MDILKIKEHLQETFDFWENANTAKGSDIKELYESSVIPYLNDAESFKLYRYFPVNYNNIRNIVKHRLSLSNGRIINDVFDGLPAGNVRSDQIDLLRSFAKIIRFYEKWDNPLLWSNYGDSFSGICVEYDLRKLSDREILKYLYPIIYRETRPVRDINDICLSIKELNQAIRDNEQIDTSGALEEILPLFIVKSSVWSYENEWRIIITEKDLYDDYLKQKDYYDFPCITGIYLGARMDKNLQDDLIENLKAECPGLSIYKTFLCDSNSYKLESMLIDS